MEVKPRLFIITLEPIEQRYTKQWYNYFKPAFSKWFEVIYIDGRFMGDKIENGKWLDINKTNIWKAHQVEQLSYWFMKGLIKDGDSFLFTDAWHWGIIPLRYMAGLQNIKIKVYGFWHAGSYDRWDFLAQAKLDWTYFTEMNFFYMYDCNFVATHFHKSLIQQEFNLKDNLIKVVGFPMDWKEEIRKLKIKRVKKEDIIIFPHRLDKEKQPQVFEQLQKSKDLNKYTFIITINKNLTKKQYYTFLSRAKIVFSSSLQETYGIGTVEGVMFDCIPIIPERLSYSEMYYDEFKYKSLDEAIIKIKKIIEHKDMYNRELTWQKERLAKDSLEAIPKMARVILNGIRK